MNFKTFNILTTDVNNKLNIRHKVLCGCQMGYCFNNAYIYSESIFDNFFTISGYSRRNYIYVWINIINLFKNFFNNRNRITAVRLILREKNFFIFRNNCCFKCSRTGIYSYICLAGISFKFTRCNSCFCVSCFKFFKFPFIFK